MTRYVAWLTLDVVARCAIAAFVVLAAVELRAWLGEAMWWFEDRRRRRAR